jgi:hypothetical protein
MWNGLNFRFNLNNREVVLLEKLENYNNFKGFDLGSVKRDTWGVEREFFSYNSKRCFYHSPDVDSLKNNRCGFFDNIHSKKILLVGDSHAAYLGHYLKKAFDNHVSFEQIEVASAGCTILSIGHDNNPQCSQFDSYVKDIITTGKPDIVIVFGDYTQSPGFTPQLLDGRLSEYKDLGAKTIIVIGPMPIWKGPLPNYLLRSYVLHHKEIPLRDSSYIVKYSIQLDSMMMSQFSSTKYVYISLAQLLCQNESCLVRVGDQLDKDLIVWDYGHLTDSGAAFIYKSLLVEHLG